MPNKKDIDDCVDWDDDEEAPLIKSLNGISSSNKESDRSLFVAVCALIAAVPAIVGSWCWPILVGAIFAVAASNVNGGLVDFFHGVQVAIMFVLVTNIVQFAWWNVKKKRRTRTVNGQKRNATHWYMYRPVYVLLLAGCLIMIQPVSMLVIGSWVCDAQFTSDQLDDISDIGNGIGKAVYNQSGYLSDADLVPKGMHKGEFHPVGCNPEMKNYFFDGGDTQNLVPNTLAGWLVQLFGTYLGFIFLFYGVVEATMLHTKLASKWRQLRRV